MILTALLLLSLAWPADPPDEQYQFIVGLADKGMHDLVISESEEFLRKHPRHEKTDLVRYRLAASLFEKDRAMEAAPHFRALAARRGFTYAAESAFRLGQSELAGGRFNEAVAAFDQALALDKAYLHGPAGFFAAEACFKAGDFADAATRYRAVLQAGDGDYVRDAGYGLAWSEFRQKRYDPAIAAIDTFLSRHQADDYEAELCFLKGECLFETRRAKDAIAWYGKVTTGPFLDAALRGSGFAAAELGDAEGAARAFTKLLKTTPDSKFAREATLQCGIQQIKAGQLAPAVATLSSPLAEGDAELLYWRAQARAKSADAQAALKDLDKALALRPDDALKERLQIARGDALVDLGRGEDAAQAYGSSNSDYALHAAAVASLNDKRYAEARRLAEQLLARFKDSPYRGTTSHVLGECLLVGKDYAGAARAFEQAAANATDDTERLRSTARLAWACFLAGDARTAAPHFAAVVDGSQDAAERAEACYMLGRAHEAAGNPNGAIAAWERYLRDHRSGTEEADVLLCLARAKPDAAPALLQRLLEDHGDHAAVPAALLQLADRMQADGDLAGALARYRELLERYPRDATVNQARYGLAWCQYESGQFDDAAAALSALLAAKPDASLTEAGSELLVFAAAKAGKAEVAQAAFQQLKKACSDSTRVLAAARTTATALVAAGHGDNADRLLAELQQSQRGAASPELLLERGWIALDRGDAGAAEKLCHEARAAAAKGAPFAELCFFVGEALFEAKQDARAIALYQLAAADPDAKVADKALYKDGFARLRNEDLDGAAKAFGTLVERHAGSELFGEALFLLGECAYRQGRFEQAITAMERLRSEAPQHEVMPKALFRLGLALCQEKRFTAGEPVLTELVRKYPAFDNLLEAELWRGRALVALGNPRAARQAFDRVIGTDQGLLAANARLEVGRIQFDAGDTEKALAEFLKVAVLYADGDAVSEGLYLAGLCLEKMGDKDRARSQYQEIVNKYPQSAFAAEAKQRLAQIRSARSATQRASTRRPQPQPAPTQRQHPRKEPGGRNASLRCGGSRQAPGQPV